MGCNELHENFRRLISVLCNDNRRKSMDMSVKCGKNGNCDVKISKHADIEWKNKIFVPAYFVTGLYVTIIIALVCKVDNDYIKAFVPLVLWLIVGYAIKMISNQVELITINLDERKELIYKTQVIVGIGVCLTSIVTCLVMIYENALTYKTASPCITLFTSLIVGKYAWLEVSIEDVKHSWRIGWKYFLFFIVTAILISFVITKFFMYNFR